MVQNSTSPTTCIPALFTTAQSPKNKSRKGDLKYHKYLNSIFLCCMILLPFLIEVPVPRHSHVNPPAIDVSDFILA
jgi:hypothetical protein